MTAAPMTPALLSIPVPISEFSHHAREVLQHMHATGLPLLLVEEGMEVAVLMDVETFSCLLEQPDLPRAGAGFRAGH